MHNLKVPVEVLAECKKGGKPHSVGQNGNKNKKPQSKTEKQKLRAWQGLLRLTSPVNTRSRRHWTANSLCSNKTVSRDRRLLQLLLKDVSSNIHIFQAILLLKHIGPHSCIWRMPLAIPTFPGRHISQVWGISLPLLKHASNKINFFKQNGFLSMRAQQLLKAAGCQNTEFPLRLKKWGCSLLSFD